MGVRVTWAAVVESADPGDIRSTQVPSLANMNTGGPERYDGGLPTPAEGKPGSQRQGLPQDHSRGWEGSEGEGKEGKGAHLP
jgi:hypothetical protein